MSNPLKIIKILSLFNLLINPPSPVEFSFSDETCETCYKIPDVNFYFHFIDAKMKVDEIFIVSERLVTIVHKCCILLISFFLITDFKVIFLQTYFWLDGIHASCNKLSTMTAAWSMHCGNLSVYSTCLYKFNYVY